MTEEDCKPDCRCILCNVLNLLDRAAELQGDHEKGLELILFAAGSLPATVEGYTWELVQGRIRAAYVTTERDILAATGDAPGDGQAMH